MKNILDELLYNMDLLNVTVAIMFRYSLIIIVQTQESKLSGNIEISK